MKRPSAAAINSQTRSKVRGRAARKNAFSLAKASSIGLKVGTVRREKPQERTGLLNRRAHLGLLVGGQIVEHDHDGPFDGLKLIGFAIWETRTRARRNVTFPARQYSVSGERRSFALLRPVTDTAAHDRIRDLIREVYASNEQEAAQSA
jgi:hypothetical protein